MTGVCNVFAHSGSDRVNELITMRYNAMLFNGRQ